MNPFFEDVGELGLGSRLKGLSERLYELADSLYRARKSSFEARWFPLMRLLRDRGPLSVTEIARDVGLSHAGISQLANRLVREGWLTTHADPNDERRRSLALTPRAESELRSLAPLWRALQETLAARDGTAELLAALSRVEKTLAAPVLQEEILTRAGELERNAVRVVPYRAALKSHFYRINAEWLQQHFYVEEIDHRVLSDPEGQIIRPGGAVLFALVGDEVVGTCALKLEGPGRYELTKMGVDPARRGAGIGRKLIEAAIAEFHKRKGRELFLESSTKLTPALKLYESVGFVHAPPPAKSHYQRADVYMEYAPKGNARARKRKSRSAKPATPRRTAHRSRP